MDDRQLLAQVMEEVKMPGQKNERLKLRITEPESKLEKYENSKNSGNSGAPPSQDPFRKTKSLRGRTERRRGGQRGRKGKKLEMAEMPGKVVPNDIASCSCCGNALWGTVPTGTMPGRCSIRISKKMVNRIRYVLKTRTPYIKAVVG